MLAFLLRYIAMTLPFFKMGMNRFRVAATSFVAIMYLGSFILVVSHMGSYARDIFSPCYTLVALLIAAAASFLPVVRCVCRLLSLCVSATCTADPLTLRMVWRGLPCCGLDSMNMIRRKLRVMREHMLDDLAEAHSEIPGKMFSEVSRVVKWRRQTSSRVSDQPPPLTKLPSLHNVLTTKLFQRRVRRVMILNMAAKIHGSKARRQHLPLSKEATSPANKQYSVGRHDVSVFSGFEAYVSMWCAALW